MAKKSDTKSSKFLDGILKGKAILSKEEAKDMERVAKKLRKEKGFRNIIGL